MKNNQPFGSPPPETVVIRIASESDASERRRFLDQIYALFDHLNWRAHIYILSDDSIGQMEALYDIAQLAREYLSEQKFSTLYIHPVFEFSQADVANWEPILSLPREFQQEAYREQGKERLIILPVLKFDQSVIVDEVIAAAGFFQNRLVKPSLYFAGEPLLDCVQVLGEDIRVYVDEFSDLSASSVAARLRSNHIFEDLLERLEGSTEEFLNPCRRHLLIDEKDDTVFACFNQFQSGHPCGSLESIFKKLPQVNQANCVGCISKSILSMRPDFEANKRLSEGAEVSLKLGYALVDRGLYRQAIAHFERGFELAADDESRSASLLNQGLCYLNLMALEQADRVLREGQTLAISPDVFLYHRGRVLMAWQDYPGALALLKMVLNAASVDIARDDLLFNLAVCHINTDDAVSASECLGKVEKNSPPVCFYQGVCLYAFGDMEGALEWFRQALGLGPAPEDLSRVLFYIGSCLKELGRYEEAVSQLREAIAVDSAEYLNHNLLGFCYFQLKQHQKAIEAFKRTIQINPRSAIDYASIGSNLRELGKPEEAIAMYQMALSLDPTLTFAAENIAKLSGGGNG